MRGIAWILASWWSAERDARHPAGGHDRDRGDVPGWVMVVVMTAALVTALMVVAVPQLRNVFTDAINSVTSGGGGGGGAGTPAGGGGG
jgi:hypothetical protein